MKKIIEIAISLLLLTISYTVSAQEWHFGGSVGYENTGLIWKQGSVAIDIDNVSGFNIGVLAEYDIRDYIGFESGVFFTMAGYQSTGDIVYKDIVIAMATEKTSLYYLMFPVYAVAKIPIGDFSINFEAGPNLFAGLSGKTTITSKTPLTEKEYVMRDIFENTLDRFNCSIHIAAGIQYMGARLMAGYNFGVYNMYAKELKQADLGNVINSRGFVISLGYLF